MHCKCIHCKKYSFTISVRSSIYILCIYDIQPDRVYNSHYSNGVLAMFTLVSVVLLKGKHCRKPNCCNVVVDTLLLNNCKESMWKYSSHILFYADLSGYTCDPRSCCTVFPCVPKYTVYFCSV